MGVEPSERTAAAVIRVWLEPGRTKANLRVRVIETTDLRVPQTRAHPAVSSIEEACDLVRAWLVAFVGARTAEPPGSAEPDAASGR